MAVASAPQLYGELYRDLATLTLRLDGAVLISLLMKRGGGRSDPMMIGNKRDVCHVSSSTRPSDIALESQPQLATLGWALRRAALGLLLLVVMVVLGAWLFYAGIDPNEAAASSPAQDGYAAPQR